MKTVTKTYGHDRGYSCCFRQHRATSHCRFLHGYALSFSFTFACDDNDVDENGWVIDFGGLKLVKAFLDAHFDHKTILAMDDPELDFIRRLAINVVPEDRMNYYDRQVEPFIDINVLQNGVGCENFAVFVFNQVSSMLQAGVLGTTYAQLIKVEVREHGSNGATYEQAFIPRS